MSIYYLYTKTHLKTGLKYLGYTKNDPYIYKGSGTYWNLHLDKHGNYVWTNILFQSEIKEEVAEKGKYYSELWNVVESEDWANLVPETTEGCAVNGDKNGMYGKTHTEEVKIFLAEKAKKRFTGKTYEELYGKVKSDELKQIRSDQMKKNIDKHYQIGNKNSNAKTILFISPDGKEYIIKGGLRKFCRYANIDTGMMIDVLKGRKQSHKGWQGKYL